MQLNKILIKVFKVFNLNIWKKKICIKDEIIFYFIIYCDSLPLSLSIMYIKYYLIEMCARMLTFAAENIKSSPANAKRIHDVCIIVTVMKRHLTIATIILADY